MLVGALVLAAVLLLAPTFEGEARQPTPDAGATAESVRGSLESLGGIPEPGATSVPRYDRDAFGENGWTLDELGCSTRERVLMRDLDDVAMRADRECKVHTGTLSPEPYTGGTIRFDSVSDPQAVQIDHVVPLSVAWRMGAWAWDPQARIEFSNDTANLLAVDGPTNNAKGDRTPGRWLPENDAALCRYARSYTEVTVKWGLSMEARDRDALAGVLERC